MNYDPLDGLDISPGKGRPLRELFQVWTQNGSMSPDENARFQTAWQKSQSDFLKALGNAPDAPPAPPPPPPGTPAPGSDLTFDASKLSAEEWAKWRKENGV
jgi:hypothetical protein